jgi:hypothetical protein
MWYLALGYSGPHARYIDRASESIHFGVTVGGTGVLGLLVLILVVILFGISVERRSWASSVSGFEAVCNGRLYSWTYYKDLASHFAAF